jgi:ATP-dependent exoDNAse (exonuclease V) alpha subunit
LNDHGLVTVILRPTRRGVFFKPQHCFEREVAVKFDQREVIYDFGELDEVVPAYAITIHKSKWSEFPAVVMPLATRHYGG